MGGESTIYLNLAALNVLPAQLLRTREASLWYFSVLRRWRMAMDLQRCRVEVMSIIRERPSFIGQFCGISYIHVDGSAIT